MSSDKSIYKTAIIGAGRIGCGFDSPQDQHVLTHAHAIAKNPRVELSAVVDTDEQKGRHEARRWDARYFRSLKEMRAVIEPDIVIIATPDLTHAQILMEIATYKPKLVICEKPVSVRAEDADKVLSSVGKIPIIVNFSRRFDPVVDDLKRGLIEGVYGRIISASGLYTKGVLHNGSHMLDLARYLFGEMLGCRSDYQVEDFPEGAPTVAGFAVFERCPQFHLVAGDARAYTVFEFDILTETARFTFVDEGRTLVTRRIQSDPIYEGYRIPGPPEVRATGLPHALETLVAHSIAVMDGTETPGSTLENALKTEEACRLFAKGEKTV